MVAASCPPRSESAVVVVDRIERALSHAVEAASENAPPRLREALAYAVFPGGARLRPRLCLAVAAALGAGPLEAAGPAAAVELLHCASLVHDDLPCFDDAALRRGRASVHAAYGEAMAVLVGDALIAAASTTLAISMASSPALPSAASDGREHARRRLVEALAAARASVPADPGAPMLHAFLEDLERTVASRLGIS